MTNGSRTFYLFFAGLLGLLLVIVGRSFKREKSTNESTGNRRTTPFEAVGQTDGLTLKADSTINDNPTQTQRVAYGETPALSTEVVYQLSVIDDAVAGMGTDILNTLPQYRAERLWLIGNLMLEEIYQEQFRNGGQSAINSNLARTQLRFYLTNNRVDKK